LAFQRRGLLRLNELIASGKWNKKDLGRVYPCPLCNQWHLTSLINESVDMRGLELKQTDKWKKILKHQQTEGERVTFQQAKELKTKGYNKPCKYWYTLFHKKLMRSEEPKNFNSFIVTKEATFHSSSYSAPTIEEYTEFKKQLKLKK
jgi:hypothetical protein